MLTAGQVVCVSNNKMKQRVHKAQRNKCTRSTCVCVLKARDKGMCGNKNIFES
jgi:hypothetical protein